MDPFIAEICMFAGNFAPRGWAFCEGQLLAISSHSALFSLLGTTYGGDGRTTFGLPDLRGRTPIHPGHGPGLSSYKLGQRGGQETVTLTQLQMPSHSHTVTVTPGTGGSTTAQGTINAGATGSTNNPSGKFLAQSGNIGPNQINVYGDASDVPMAAGSVTVDLGTIPTPTVQVFNNGGSQWHTNLQPYVAINYIIALVGTFPSRS